MTGTQCIFTEEERKGGRQKYSNKNYLYNN